MSKKQNVKIQILDLIPIVDITDCPTLPQPNQA
jgi:hypothetical protein